MTQCPAFGQRHQRTGAISMHLELPKDTLLLGEPSFFYYVLHNHSNKSIYVGEESVGNGYEAGFNIYLISSENDTLKQRELWGCFGGYWGYQEIKPHESQRHKLFLPMYADIPKAGNYTLRISKKFSIAPCDPYASEKSDFSKIKHVPRESSIALPVVDNQERLGKFITNMIEAIKAETQGQLIEESGIKTGAQSYKPMSENLSDYLLIITELKDEQIIPFLIDCYRHLEHFTPNKTINYLAQHPDSEGVLDVLIDAAQGPDNSKYEIFSDSISISWSGGFTRQIALRAIMQCQNTKAMDFLLSKKNDVFTHERYLILLQASAYLNKENRLKIYEAFKDDAHPAVAKKARAGLGSMRKE